MQLTKVRSGKQLLSECRAASRGLPRFLLDAEGRCERGVTTLGTGCHRSFVARIHSERCIAVGGLGIVETSRDRARAQELRMIVRHQEV